MRPLSNESYSIVTLVRGRTHRPCVPTTGYSYHRYSYRWSGTGYSYRWFGTDAQTVRPYNGLHVSLYYNGRTDRASLQRATRIAVLQRTHRPCVPTTGYSYRCTTTDAQTVRPYNGLLVSLVRGRVTRIAGSGRRQSLLVTLCYGLSTWGFAIFDVGIVYSPRRRETFPPKFHLIPRKFYFSPTWGLFYSYVGICDFPRGGCTFGLMRLWRVTSPTV